MSTVSEPLSRPGRLPVSVFPYPIRAIGTGDERIAYVDAGTGPTVLLVHVGMWSLIWRDLLAELTPAARCVAMDAPATGFSGGSPRAHATVGVAADRLAELIDRLELTDIHLVCHDLGGPVAFLALRDRADRVRSLTMVNTFAWRPAGALFRGMLAVMGSAPMREIDAGTGLLPALTSGRFGAGRRFDPATRRAFRAGFGVRGRRSLHRYLHDTLREDIWPDIDRSLAALTDRPTTTIFGEHNDPLRFQPEWRRRIPHARSLVVPGGNHFPMCDDPALVAAAIRDRLSR